MAVQTFSSGAPRVSKRLARDWGDRKLVLAAAQRAKVTDMKLTHQHLVGGKQLMMGRFTVEFRCYFIEPQDLGTVVVTDDNARPMARIGKRFSQFLLNRIASPRRHADDNAEVKQTTQFFSDALVQRLVPL
ncbi:hypothetical protein XarbCFBP8132_11860 [Xanthomonas arboricola]|nr:hypothetical protein XarbCFBP8132_11860 [Xanthomonas arboricola]